MKKKLMALLLSLTMVVTLIPAMSLTAFAFNPVGTDTYHLELVMNRSVYTEGEGLDYDVYAVDQDGQSFRVNYGSEFTLQYQKNGGSWHDLYDDRSLSVGSYQLIANANYGAHYHWDNPASNIVSFTVTGRRYEKLPITIYAPTLWINTGDAIPDITYRYEVTGLDWGDNVYDVLDFEPTLRYVGTPNSKKAGTYTITFRSYPDVNRFFEDKYYIAGYMDGSLVVKEDKSDNEKAFETYRTEKANDCDRLYVVNDTADIKNIAINAKANILNTSFNKNKSLQQNCDVVYTIYNNAVKAIQKKRDAADEANDKAQIKATKPEIDDIDPIKKGAKIYITKDTYHEEDGEDIETYQIARATKKNGTYKRVKTVTNTDSHKRTITAKVKNLKPGRTYYFKVRGVVTLSNGKKVYTKWSKPDYVVAY